MKVLGVSAAYDPAGDLWRTSRAFADSQWQYRCAVRRPTRWAYPVDLPWSQAGDAWRSADVVHLALGFEAETLLHAPRRPTVIHHHGTSFRLHRDRLLAEQRRRKAKGLASTLDLVLMAPHDLEWSPTPYDMDWLASLRRPIDDGVLRIAHAPTDRAIKSTDAFLVAVGRLSQEVRIELVLIEGQTWSDCLAAKASADIYFDQVILGYGCNAVEAWGMGIPVVAGGAQATLEEIQRRAGRLPFVPADEGSIYDALRTLAEPEARAHWGTVGRDFARRFHAEDVAQARLSAIFAAA